MIREFEARDINHCISLAREQAVEADVLETLPIDDVHMTKTIKNILVDPNNKCFVVEENGNMVGYALMGLSYKVWNPSLFAEVYFFFVHPTIRNKYIADSLFNKCVSYAREQGCRWIEWGVSNFTKDFKGAEKYLDRASNYFEHRGCEPCGYNFVLDLEKNNG